MAQAPESPIKWDSSSSDAEENSVEEVIEDSTPVAFTLAEETSFQAQIAATLDRSSRVTCKFPPRSVNNMTLKRWKAAPIMKPQGSLKNPLWAIPTEELAPESISAPRQPASSPVKSQNGLAQSGNRQVRAAQHGASMTQVSGFCQPQPLRNGFTGSVPSFGHQQPVTNMKFNPALSRPQLQHVKQPRLATPHPQPPRFVAALPSRTSNIDYPIAPIVSSKIFDSLHEFKHLTHPNSTQIGGDVDEFPDHDYHKSETLTVEEKDARNKELQSHAKTLKRTVGITEFIVESRKAKKEMTINQYKTQILQMVKHNAAVVIAAATGSGKTTQLPQIILEDAIESGHGADCNIWVTQPRRVAATSVARRVAKERSDGGLNSVGHHVKFDVKLPKAGGCITYCTTGILLMRIQRRPGEVFDNVSHIIVDEAHERDMIIDRLLAILKWQLFTRKNQGLKFPKIIVSSATLDIELFTNYFAQPIIKDGARCLTPCPYLDIPGRMFPVTSIYLMDILAQLQQFSPKQQQFMEDDKPTKAYLEMNMEVRNEANQLQPLKPQSDTQEAMVPTALIALTIALIVRTGTEGAILVFLPGLDSINKVRSALEINSLVTGVNFNEAQFRIVVLHSDMGDTNDAAFDKMPKGVRKIVLATNIAEASITIPDAVYGECHSHVLSSKVNHTNIC